jgi:hygromycin-B 7''-O-kinase
MKLPGFEDFERFFGAEVWREAAQIICRKHRIPFRRLARAAQGDSIIFLIDEQFVVKIYHPTGARGFERERLALETARTRLKIPEIVAAGEIENYLYLVTTQIRGEQPTRADWLKFSAPEQVSVLAQLAEGLRELHQCSDASRIDFDWDGFIESQAASCFERQQACGVNEKVLAQIPAYLETNLHLLPAPAKKMFLHGDVHFGNLRLSKAIGKWEISGLFDFADSLKGFFEYDFLAVCVLMIQGQGDLQREFFRAYGYRDNEINEDLRKRQMLLTMFYECSDLRRYAVRLSPAAVDFSLLELEKAIWNF